MSLPGPWRALAMRPAQHRDRSARVTRKTGKARVLSLSKRCAGDADNHRRGVVVETVFRLAEHQVGIRCRTQQGG